MARRYLRGLASTVPRNRHRLIDERIRRTPGGRSQQDNPDAFSQHRCLNVVANFKRIPGSKHVSCNLRFEQALDPLDRGAKHHFVDIDPTTPPVEYLASLDPALKDRDGGAPETDAQSGIVRQCVGMEEHGFICGRVDSFRNQPADLLEIHEPHGLLTQGLMAPRRFLVILRGSGRRKLEKHLDKATQGLSLAKQHGKAVIADFDINAAGMSFIKMGIARPVRTPGKVHVGHSWERESSFMTDWIYCLNRKVFCNSRTPP